MPNLLLDLDAEGSRHVRPFEAADELAMAQTFSISQRRAEVKLKMKDLERQVLELRSKTEEILKNPAHPWRLTRYDLLSAALQCPIANAMANMPENQTIQWIDTRVNETFESIIEHNGVPAHATENDQHLLEWLLLRSRALRHHMATGTDKNLTFNDFSAALTATNDLAEIRRITTSYLSSIGSQQPKPTFALEVRDAVFATIAQDPTYTSEALVFMSNITRRLKFSKDEADVFVPFTLRLSAMLGNLDATTQWLKHLSTNGISRNMTTAIGDTFYAIQSLNRWIHGSDISEKQHIFQLITGYNGADGQQPSLALLCRTLLDSQPSPEAVAAYEIYVESLGHLGAANLLKAEAQHAAKATEGIPSLQLAFQNAEKNFSSAAGSSKKQPNSTSDWGQLAKADYESLQVSKAPEDLGQFKLTLKDYIEGRT